MTPLPKTVADVLSSHLDGLREAGVRALPWRGPLPEPRTPPPAPPPPPPAPPAPSAPLEPPAESAVLTRSPPPPPVMTPGAPRIVVVPLRRLEACGDAPDQPGRRLLLVLDEEELAGDSAALLQDMLRATGYEREGAPRRFTTEEPVNPDHLRILIMGNDALQQASPAGMDLQIVRGMWQETPSGTSIATYAPSAVSDSPSGKKAVWNDLKRLLDDLGLSIPEWTKAKLKRS